MKSLKFAILFGAMSLIFMGCPYESKFAVDDSSNSKGDKALVGKYSEKGDDSYEWNIKLNGNSYTIEKIKKDGGDITTYNGFISMVGGRSYLNVWEKVDEGAEHKFYIYSIEKKDDAGNRVKLKAMTDNVTEEFASSAELQAFIKKYQDLSFFWNKDDEKTFYKED